MAFPPCLPHGSRRLAPPASTLTRNPAPRYSLFPPGDGLNHDTMIGSNTGPKSLINFAMISFT
jgi:hypothetical protein